MPSKAKTSKASVIEAPENKMPLFTKVVIPLVQPTVGKREEGSVYVTKAAYEKGMEEYLASAESFASIYSSSEEYLKVFSGDDDNDVKKEFMAYAIDRRRRVGEVCGATTDTVIIKLPTSEPDLIKFVQSSVAVLRFYYDAAGKNKLELKKGTSIHVIEVAIIGPNPNENQVPFADGPMTPEVANSDSEVVSEQ